MATERHTKVRGEQVLNRSITKADLDATGETEGHVATVQADGSIDFEAGGGAGTSNVIFAWSGNELASASASGYGLAQVGVTNKPDRQLGTVEIFVSGNAASLKTVLNFKFKKIAGIDTITIHARLYTGSGNPQSYLKVDIGGQNNFVQRSSSTPGWATTSDIDVSGLSNGTVYDGIVQHKSTGDQDGAHFSALTLIAS